MIEVDIKLIPFGILSRTESIGTITIINDESGNHKTGNYIYRIKSDRTNINGNLKGYERNKGILCLLRDILNNSNLEE